MSMAVALITSVVQAAGRYYTVLFPLYFSAALLLEDRPAALMIVLYVCAAVSGILIACFTNGYWVA